MANRDDWIAFVITLTAFAILFGLIGAVLGGCGDDDSPGVPTPQPTATPEPPQNPRCEGIEPIADGFLWKPKSDPDGATPNKLVILFPAKFTERFLEVIVQNESGRFTGFSNGDRQTWRFASEGCFYGGNIIVEAVDRNQSCFWEIPDGCKRWEW